jgi:hypothetical protein
MKKAKAFFRAQKTKNVLQTLGRIIAAIGVVGAGWAMALIAGGMREGIAPHLLPQTLPLLVSGVWYIDRFAAVFGVILAAATLVHLCERSPGVFKSAFGAMFLVLGVISAATPMTLIAWLLVVTLGGVRAVAQKERMGFVFAMGAMMLSILLLSGGAFLADMTIVASISSQLPEKTVLLALVFLFAGALASVRWFAGAYLLIPMYITLRLCLFFLGTAPTLLITLVALLSALMALYFARKRNQHAIMQSYMYLLFFAVPLTMIAVNMQIVTAVQCFLFGGITLAAAGILGDYRRGGVQGQEKEMSIQQFLLSPLPGTLPGMGLLLLFAGLGVLWQAAETVGEKGFTALLIVITLGTTLFLARFFVQQGNGGTQRAFVGGVQSFILLIGAIAYAHILSYLGTTIGGEAPDARIEIAFAETVLTLIPWMLLGASALFVGGAMIMKKKKPDAWAKIAGSARAFVERIEGYLALPKVATQGGVYGTSMKQTLNAALTEGEHRLTQMTMKEASVVLLAFFLVTLIILF